MLRCQSLNHNVAPLCPSVDPKG